MSGERSVLPSAARLHQAHAAGVRLRSRWWTVAAVALALWVGLELWQVDLASAGRWWAEALALASPRGPAGSASSDVGHFVVTGLQWGVGGLAALLGVGLLAVLGGHAASGAWGPISSGTGDRLQMQRLPSFALPGLGLTAVAGVVIAWTLRGVVAGAARSIDASTAGLFELWTVWASRGLLGIALGCAVAGLLEVRWRSRARARALQRTVAQLRAELRERGRGR